MVAYVEEVAAPGLKLPDRNTSDSNAVRLSSTNLAVEHYNTALLDHRFIHTPWVYQS